MLPRRKRIAIAFCEFGLVALVQTLEQASRAYLIELRAFGHGIFAFLEFREFERGGNVQRFSLTFSEPQGPNQPTEAARLKNHASKHHLVLRAAKIHHSRRGRFAAIGDDRVLKRAHFPIGNDIGVWSRVQGGKRFRTEAGHVEKSAGERAVYEVAVNDYCRSRKLPSVEMAAQKLGTSHVKPGPSFQATPLKVMSSNSTAVIVPVRNVTSVSSPD